jgi:hypothetical protein
MKILLNIFPLKIHSNERDHGKNLRKKHLIINVWASENVYLFPVPFKFNIWQNFCNQIFT